MSDFYFSLQNTLYLSPSFLLTREVSSSQLPSIIPALSIGNIVALLMKRRSISLYSFASVNAL